MMSDDSGISTKLDRITPAERTRDPKDRMVSLENPGEGKRGKGKSEKRADDDLEEKEISSGSSGEGQSGKILDIVI